MLHHFHLPLRPGEVDALMARYDSTGMGKISYTDFVSRLLPADYPTVRRGGKLTLGMAWGYVSWFGDIGQCLGIEVRVWG